MRDLCLGMLQYFHSKRDELSLWSDFLRIPLYDLKS